LSNFKSFALFLWSTVAKLMELLTVIKCPGPTHQLSVHVLPVCRVLLISELHLLCTVCTTIAPMVLHFSAVHLSMSFATGNEKWICP